MKRRSRLVTQSRSDDWHATRLSRERLRRRYRPDEVRLLFVGESPPASGRFFYRCDSGLYRAMREAFATVLPPMDDADFLDAFKAMGCYLVDACPYPVDRLHRHQRMAACAEGEGLLTRRIRELKPQLIATLVRSIRGNVERAAGKAGWHGRLVDLPYPGRWIRHREAFLKLLTPEITTLASEAKIEDRLVKMRTA